MVPAVVHVAGRAVSRGRLAHIVSSDSLRKAGYVVVALTTAFSTVAVITALVDIV